ncbi:MAG: hypothetical protein OHK0038_05000 [Flammeovirgaceae bacterium]
MMKLKNAIWSVIALLALGLGSAFAQETDENGYSFNSIRPIRNADIMFKKTIWYRLDLKEKQNSPFASKNLELTKVIIDAVKAGVLRPYKNDSLNARMPLQEFLENLKIPGAEETGDDIFGGGGSDDWGGGGGWGDDGGGGWGDDGGGGGAAEGGKKAEAIVNELFPKEIYQLDIKEDMIFDRKRSRVYHDIQSITLIFPAERNPAGYEKQIATFSYKELVEQVFVDNGSAIWYNNLNPGEHRNFADAFDLRLFAKRIWKFANSKDESIEDKYGGNPELALFKGLEYEHKLLDQEAELWSY